MPGAVVQLPATSATITVCLSCGAVAGQGGDSNQTGREAAWGVSFHFHLIKFRKQSAEQIA